MQFQVLPKAARTPTFEGTFLFTDHWDDWATWSTQYRLLVVDAEKNQKWIGDVKIGQIDMPHGQRRPAIPEEFDSLPEEFFSLGQDDEYYDNLNQLGSAARDRILQALRDIAADENIYTRAIQEEVTKRSLMRGVSEAAAKGQYRRMTTGGARLTPYAFEYRPPVEKDSDPVKLKFTVTPESYPPTNLHVIIGRNGVGKTRMLTLMTRTLLEDSSSTSKVGAFFIKGELTSDTPFANLVSVTFSAFDTFEPPTVDPEKTEGIRYYYIGLKRASNAGQYAGHPKSPQMLEKEFAKSVRACVHGPKAQRWRKALELLEADPIFKESEVATLADLGSTHAPVLEEDAEAVRTDPFSQSATAMFRGFSSGHKIVLLTITRLVETVQEKTLVLLDEPEAHLHPPLLSAFARSLSDLLIDRNGVAIIATHSPVILQEVPKLCAWILRRNGSVVNADRPTLETFGENVGVLTREVFGLEVTETGFHKLLRHAVEVKTTYEGALELFDDKLGTEARAILRAMIEARKAQEEEA